MVPQGALYTYVLWGTTMRRYTVTFCVVDKSLDGKGVLRTLNSIDPEVRQSIVFKGSTQVDNRVLVELESRKDKSELATLFVKLALPLGIQFEEIAWGWLVSDPVLRDPSTVNRAIYPATPRISHQPLDRQKYAYSLTMTLANIYMCTLFLISIAAFAVGLLDWVYPLAFFGPDTTCTMWFCCPIYALAIFHSWHNRARMVICDQNGIEVHYLLRLSQKCSWDEIVGMELYWALIRNEQWCSIQGRSRSFDFSINELVNGNVLLMTIIQHAKLLYVDGMLWENTVYKRSDAP
ncbi:MAG: hypothetical protein JXB07_21290 [Anaerolineae bacterium]|nr:hypothetical protein [Anaerolineae bacterium]